MEIPSPLTLIVVVLLITVYSTEIIESRVEPEDFFLQETESDLYPPKTKTPTPEEQSCEYARERMMQRLAAHGVELHDYDTLLRFEKQYHQLIYMPLPFTNDYVRHPCPLMR